MDEALKYLSSYKKRFEERDDRRGKGSIFRKIRILFSNEEQGPLDDLDFDSPSMVVEEVEETEYGRLVWGNGVVVASGKPGSRVYETWGNLAPLIMHPKIEEVFIRGNHVLATHSERGVIRVIARFRPFDLQLSLVRAGANVSEAKPLDTFTWIEGNTVLRVLVKLPRVSLNQINISVTKLRKIPFLGEIFHPLLAAKIAYLALSAQTIMILGPLGSGKTTALSSLLEFIIKYFPEIRISIVEYPADLVIPEEGNYTRSIPPDPELLKNYFLASVRMERFRLVVLGELRSEDVRWWADFLRSGVTFVTTFHSPDIETAIKVIEEKWGKPRTEVLGRINLWIEMGFHVRRGGVTQRFVRRVFLSRGGNMVPLYTNGSSLAEEEWLKIIPPNMLGEDPRILYDFLKNILSSGDGDLDAPLQA